MNIETDHQASNVASTPESKGRSNQNNNVVSDSPNANDLLLINPQSNTVANDQRQDGDQENAKVAEENSNEEKAEVSKKRCRLNCSKRSIISGTIFITFIITIVVLFFVFQEEIFGFADDYARFMDNNKALAIFIFTIAYIIGMGIFITETLFIFSGAYIFGKVFGFGAGFGIFVCIDYFCNQVGCLVAFFNARYFFRSCIQGCIKNNRKLTAVSQALSINAKKLVALMRICSMTPYWVLNCICGITNMSVLDYMIGNIPTFIADIPYIYVCASISDVSKLSSSNPLGYWYYVLLAVGLVIIIIVVILITIFAKRELNKTMKNIENQKNGSEQEQQEEAVHVPNENQEP